MDTTLIGILVTGTVGLVSALLVFLQPIVVELLKGRREARQVTAPPVLPDDPPVQVDDEVTFKGIAQALAAALQDERERADREAARADACELREGER